MSGARDLSRLAKWLDGVGELSSGGVQGGITFNSRVLTYATLPISGDIGDIIYVSPSYRIWNGSSWDIISTSVP